MKKSAMAVALATGFALVTPAFAGDPLGFKDAGKQIADETKKDVKDTKDQAVDSATAPVRDAKQQAKDTAAGATGAATGGADSAAGAVRNQREAIKGSTNDAMQKAAGTLLGVGGNK